TLHTRDFYRPLPPSTALYRHITPMRPSSLTYSGHVGVSIEAVFQLLTDPTRMAEWLPNCVSVVPGPQGKGKGDRHRLHSERNGRKADAVIEVIEFVPPTSYGWVELDDFDDRVGLAAVALE